MVVCAVFAAGFLWLRSLAAFEMPERFLAGRSGTATAGRVEAL